MRSAGMPETRARNNRHSREALIRKDVTRACESLIQKKSLAPDLLELKPR